MMDAGDESFGCRNSNLAGILAEAAKADEAALNRRKMRNAPPTYLGRYGYPLR